MIQTGTRELTAEDLLLNENLLQKELQTLFPFQSGSVSFPASHPEGMSCEDGFQPLLEAESKRLLVPLALQGRLLGIFIAQEVETADLPKLAFIQRYSELCLENLCLRKERDIDPLTCLYRQDAFVRSIAREIEQISNHLLAPSAAVDPEGECKGRFGIAVLEPDHLESLQRGFGYMVTERFVQQLAGELSLHSPAQAIAARLENDRFGLLLPGSGPADCLTICQDIKDKLDGLVTEHPATGERLTSTIRCGSAVYPLHLDGHEMKTQPQEQARLILDKGLHALKTSQKLGGNQVLCFSDILNCGGSILSVTSEGRIRVDLGRRARADEGHRFAVVRPAADRGSSAPPGPSIKAEVLLVEVGHEEAAAEVLYLNAPFDHLRPGDRLQRLSPEEEGAARNLQYEPSGERQASPMPLRHFLAGWQEHCRNVETFSLALCRMESRPSPLQGTRHEAESNRMAEWIDAALLREMLPRDGLIGEYGSDSLALYLPGMGNAEGEELLSSLSSLLIENGQIRVSIGLASYPCLQFTPRDMLSNARYALEHAQLLHPPRIAVFDSVTLTMIGDRRFAARDLPAAAEYYGLALYLNAANRVARNSLGICHAKLGNPGRAQREFETVLEADERDSMAWYNLGFVQLKQGSWEAAQSSFNRCLELVPDHVYALIRLGQLAEKQGDLQQARAIFQRAGQSEQGARTSFKYLAKLDLQEGDRDGARSNLQQAIVANPWDAEAQYLLARLYLKTGEDVHIAESLAQKAVSLRPEAETYRQLLERIFLLQDKPMQAGLLHTRQAGSGKPEPFTPGSA